MILQTVSHTNIDVVNDGLKFVIHLILKHTTYLTQTSENYGIGRVGDIVLFRTIEELALKSSLLLP